MTFRARGASTAWILKTAELFRVLFHTWLCGIDTTYSLRDKFISICPTFNCAPIIRQVHAVCELVMEFDAISLHESTCPVPEMTTTVLAICLN